MTGRVTPRQKRTYYSRTIQGIGRWRGEFFVFEGLDGLRSLDLEAGRDKYGRSEAKPQNLIRA